MPFPSPRDLPDPGIEPDSPTLQTDTLPSEPPRNYTVEVTNRLKELDLIECLKNYGLEVHDIVQVAVIETITKTKKCKKAKWLSEEPLQIAEKRREAKGKGEKEGYIHLNAEFQRIARRDRKPS